MLILSTYDLSNKPIITDLYGNWDSDFSFTIEDGVEVQSSCSVTFRGEFFIYGGKTKKNQIAKVVGCSLKDSQLKLPFEMNAGACAVTTQDQLYLCFGEETDTDEFGELRQSCHKSNKPTTDFIQIGNSSHPHGNTQIAASESKYKPYSSCIELTFRTYCCMWGRSKHRTSQQM